MIRIARVLAVVVVAAALVVLAAVMQAKLAQRRAEIVMQELKAMRAGQTDYRVLKELLRRTG